MTYRRGTFSTAVLLLAVMLAAACTTDLTAVREWSKTSLEATQYNQIVATYTDTPQRLARYDPSPEWNTQADLRQRQAEALREMLSLVGDYMAALNALSTDPTVDYMAALNVFSGDETADHSAEADALTGSLSNLNAGISADTLGAVGSLVATISGAVANAYQSAEVANIVEEANEPLQTILAGELRNIVDQDFRRDLEIEKTSIDLYYDELLRIGGGSKPANVALQEWFELHKRENAQRLLAVDAYVEILDKIADGHQTLYDNRDDLGAEHLVGELFKLGKEIRGQMNVLAGS